MNGGTPLPEPSFRPPYGRTTSTSCKLADRWTTALTRVRCAYHDAADGGEGDTGKGQYGSDGLTLMVMSAVVTALWQAKLDRGLREMRMPSAFMPEE